MVNLPVVYNSAEGIAGVQRFLRINPTAYGTKCSKTTECIKLWQEKNSLSPDGVIGINTAKALHSQITVITEEDKKILGQIVPLHIFDEIMEYGFLEGFSKYHLIHQLAQMSHETRAFTAFSENLTYTTKERLLQIFKSRLNKNNAAQFVRNPKGLANFVYGGRNGNTGPDDGWNYRGQGGIHLTFKDNYEEFNTWLHKRGITDDVVQNPSLVASKYIFTSAYFFLDSNGLFSEQTNVPTSTSVYTVRAVVNKYIGLAETIKLFNKYKLQFNC
jgi:putative chitinase